MKRPTLYHPHTGQVLAPLYVTKRGRVVYPILGAAEDDVHEETDDDADGDDDDDSTDDSKDADSSKPDDEDKPVVPQWKYDKMVARMQAADRRASAAEKLVSELKAAQVNAKDVDATLKAENEKLAPKAEKLEKTNTELRLQLAFLSASTIDWVDASAALKLVDLSDVDIDTDSGKVDERALRAALKTLAKEKPYLVRSATKDDGTDDSAASGSKLNGKRKGDKPTVDREALAKRFPALRG